MHSSTFSFRPFIGAFLLGFAVLGVGTFAATERLIRSHVVPNHNKYAYLELFRRPNVEGVSFGDSMMEAGLIGRPDLINLAQGGEAYFSMEKRIRLYLEDHRPRRMIVEAGIHHFAPSWSTTGKNDISGFKAALRDDLVLPFKSLHPFHKAEIFLYWQRWLQGSDFASTRSLTEYGGVRIFGDFSRLDPRTKRISTRQQAQYWSSIPVPETSEVGRNFHALLEDLKSHGIEVCIVTPPMAESLRSRVLEKPVVEDVEAFFAQTAGKFNFKYANFLRFELDDVYFNDASHLNYSGATLFSDRVYKACFSDAV